MDGWIWLLGAQTVTPVGVTCLRFRGWKMTKNLEPRPWPARLHDQCNSAMHRTPSSLTVHTLPPLPNPLPLGYRSPDSQGVCLRVWLEIAGCSPSQVSVSNQSESLGRENQPIRAVSRFNNTKHWQPEHVSIFPPGGWVLAKTLREAPLFHDCWGRNSHHGTWSD